MVHKLDEKPRKFILSYYRTKDLKRSIYQCNACLVRFTNKWRDHIGHEIIKILDPTLINSFPPSVIGLVHKRTFVDRKGYEVITSYD